LPINFVVTGIYGNSGQYVDSIAVACSELRADGTLGPESASSARYGGDGGGFFDIECPPGQAAAGIYGGAGGYIDRIGLYCMGPPFNNVDGAQRTTSDNGGSSPGQPNNGAEGHAGGNGGRGFDMRCDRPFNNVNVLQTGPVLTGLGVWFGEYLDGMAIQCGIPIPPSHGDGGR